MALILKNLDPPVMVKRLVFRVLFVLLTVVFDNNVDSMICFFYKCMVPRLY